MRVMSFPVLRSLAALLLVGFFVGQEAHAQDADCYSIGQQVAAENGGTLARASTVTRGEQTFCIVVVLVPGKDGARPRRAEFEVPAK